MVVEKSGRNNTLTYIHTRTHTYKQQYTFNKTVATSKWPACVQICRNNCLAWRRCGADADADDDDDDDDDKVSHSSVIPVTGLHWQKEYFLWNPLTHVTSYYVIKRNDVIFIASERRCERLATSYELRKKSTFKTVGIHSTSSLYPGCLETC